MASSYLDRYGRNQTICHRLSPLTKLLLTLVVIITTTVIPITNWPLMGVLACLIFIGHSIAHIPMNYLLRRLGIFIPIVFMLSISLPVSQGFARGWEMMATVFVRSTLAFTAGLWLINVMPFDQLLQALRRIYVPTVVVAMLAFMYRYVFVLWDELARMRTARNARNFEQVSLFQKWKYLAQMIGLLLIRSMDRAERVYKSMLARGWDGHVRTLTASPAQPEQSAKN